MRPHNVHRQDRQRPFILKHGAAGVDERRETRRFPLSADAKLLWRDRASAWHAAEGKTLDVSTAGILISSAGIPPPSAIVRCHVVLPPLEQDGMHLAASGRVVRTETKAAFALQCRAVMMWDESHAEALWKRLLARHGLGG